MRIRGKIDGPGQREFSLCVNPKAKDGIYRSKTLKRAELGPTFSRNLGLSSPCNFFLFIYLPSISYILRENSFCDSLEEVRCAVTVFCRKSSQLHPCCDLSRHSTLMQNKDVNRKCHLITVSRLTTSQCIRNGVFHLSWGRGADDGCSLVSVQMLLLTSEVMWCNVITFSQ